MKPIGHALLSAIALAAAPLLAQAPATDAKPTISRGMNSSYAEIKQNLVDTANKVPDADYAFRPTPSVRTIGQLLAHVADTQVFFCSAAKGDYKEYSTNLEKTKSTKADIVKALGDSFALCDPVYAGMTDEAGTQAVTLGKSQVARASLLMDNIAHDNEHYGNLVTYMRIKNIVPPSTAREGSQ